METKDKKITHNIFGIKYLYIDDKTRVRYGFSLFDLGVSYRLQRKKLFWRTSAWTYNLSGRKISGILEYLFWYEEKNNNKCAF